VGELIKHRVAADKIEAGVAAFNAGLDMDMVTASCLELEAAVKDGRVSMKTIDRACRNVLEAKYKLGLFENPYKHLDKSLSERIFTDESRAIARKVTAESFVLLKNDGALPLKKKGTVALVGPLADQGAQYVGTWTGAAFKEYPSLLDAFKEVEGIKVLHARGSNFEEDAKLEEKLAYRYKYERDNRSEAQMIAEAVAAARKADVVVAAVGECGYGAGESTSRTNLNLPGCQKRLLEALVKTGKPVVMVLFSGRPMTIAWEDQNMDAILEAWHGGSETGAALADVLFGDTNPSGKITMTFPYTLGQIPIYYNQKSNPRPAKPGRKSFSRYSSNWIDSPMEPLYPFGYGLSYTSFEFSEPVLSDTLMVNKAAVKASVTVTNTGSYDGAEVVQLYIRDVVTPNYTRPVKELKGFKKVFIKAGESVTVDFEVTPEMLSWYEVDQYNMSGSSKPLSAKLVLEPGDFMIMAGPNSRDTKETKLTVK
jgi:beta-glucosidase